MNWPEFKYEPDTLIETEHTRHGERQTWELGMGGIRVVEHWRWGPLQFSASVSRAIDSCGLNIRRHPKPWIELFTYVRSRTEHFQELRLFGKAVYRGEWDESEAA